MKLTKRGEIVLAIGVIALALLAVIGIYKVATSIHWTGTGYCIGSIEECLLEREGK